MSTVEAVRLCSRCQQRPRDYKNGRCKQCQCEDQKLRYWSDPDAARARQREVNRRRRENPVTRDRISRQRCAKNHGLTLEEYDALITRAAGVCEICDQDPHDEGRNGRAMIDHCHDTGKVRGVLCRRCNSGIGLLGDDPDILIKAAAYLREHKTATL